MKQVVVALFTALEDAVIQNLKLRSIISGFPESKESGFSLDALIPTAQPSGDSEREIRQLYAAFREKFQQQSDPEKALMVFLEGFRGTGRPQ